jgi:hypothetical protein
LTQNTEKKMRETIKNLFKNKKIDIIIGFQNGSLFNSARPYFVRCLEDVENLVWNEHCVANLAVFLPELFERPQRPKEGYKPPRIGVIVKGCDGRSVAGLIKENQAPKDSVITIGMPCMGMKSPAKNKKDKTDVNRACVECINPVYQAADIIISGESRKQAKTSYARIKAFEAKSPEQRWKVFIEEISKCIRCNACRQACPNCYCKVCFADQRKPSWVSPAAELSDTIVFHLGRMFHQAGRCVECDACVNACPMGIDLRLFTQKLALDSRDLFGCVPGVTGDEVPALQTFRQDDSERFITDPEEK